ncbi:ABC transporter permease [Pseudonocardia sp. RS010]|uniref:ABC transporter permease n=1 Tax=Pseudonocardia sp. RS010 TaxID=3385979 RepID=UPI0039A0FF54
MTLPDTESRGSAMPDRAPGTARTAARRRVSLGFGRFSGLYLAAVLIVVFGLWQPSTFLTVTTLRTVADQQAITAMLALALVVPMATGAFDISIPSTMTLSLVLVAKMQSSGWGVAPSLLVALLAGLLIGLVNAVAVVRLHVNSFVATLGSGSVITGCAFWVTGGQPIVRGFSPGFLAFGQSQVLGVPVPVLLLVVLAAVLWVVLEHTPVGRYLYATGSNAQAARLAGLRTTRFVLGALVSSAALAALAGMLLAAKLGVGTHDVGAPYLLPVFAAAFLGATQVYPGRVNVPGTVIAVYLLAVGVKGLQLAGAEAFVTGIFNGLALVVAVALASRRRTVGPGPV